MAVGQDGVVLEGHLERQRHAAEVVGDPLARQRQQLLAEAAGLVAFLRLEVGAHREEGLDEARLRGSRRGGEARHLLGGGEENIGQRLVAVDVEEERAAAALHLDPHQKHLGAGQGVGLAPFAVEVAPGGVGAQVAARCAIRVHVRHDVQHRVLAHLARDRVGVVEQALEQALDEPLRHGLAGVLAGDDPHRHPPRRVAPDRHQVEVAPVDGATEVAHAGVGRELDAREQVEVALVRIGLEVGVVEAVALGGVLDDELAVLVARAGDAEPVLAVVGRDAAVVLPAVRVGRARGVLEHHAHRLAGRAHEAEVEPLVEVGGVVLAQAQADVGWIVEAHDLDRARVEGGADLQHAHSSRRRKTRVLASDASAAKA